MPRGLSVGFFLSEVPEGTLNAVDGQTDSIQLLSHFPLADLFQPRGKKMVISGMLMA